MEKILIFKEYITYLFDSDFLIDLGNKNDEKAKNSNLYLLYLKENYEEWILEFDTYSDAYLKEIETDINEVLHKNKFIIGEETPAQYTYKYWTRRKKLKIILK